MIKHAEERIDAAAVIKTVGWFFILEVFLETEALTLDAARAVSSSVSSALSTQTHS